LTDRQSEGGRGKAGVGRHHLQGMLYDYNEHHRLKTSQRQTRYLLRLAMIKRWHKTTNCLVTHTYDLIVSFGELMVNSDCSLAGESGLRLVFVSHELPSAPLSVFALMNASGDQAGHSDVLRLCRHTTHTP
jgi:hypothetical protein